MPTVYNNSPYFDDFDPTKKFYRILFRPGRAVQARELTQLQTTLQNQIEVFGKNIFKDGTKISGGEIAYSHGFYIKIQETSDIDAFQSVRVTGQTSGAKALVKKISNSYSANGVDYPSALHIVYTSGISNFERGETITIDGTTTSVTVEDSTTFSGQTYFLSVEAGIFFTKGHFCYSDAQTVLLSKTFTYQPSAVIGFEVTEDVITSDDDASLLDPASGSSNYFAPGADRYTIELTLVSHEYNPEIQYALANVATSPDFIKMVNVEVDDIISTNQSTQFNEVEKFVAKRTFDESGDYTVRPFIAKLYDHKYGNVDLATLEISSGKAFVKGFEFETSSPIDLDFERARSSEFVNGYSIDLSYGRNITVANVFGYAGYTESQQVQIFSRPANTISSSNAYVYFSAPFVANPSNANSYVNSYHIGNARVRYLSTADLNTYNLYLFDLNIKAGNTFSEARSFIAANVMNGANVTLFACNVYANAAITYSRDDTYLFPIPQENIKTFKTSGVSDTTSKYFRNFGSTTFTTSGGFSNAVITLTGNDSWVGSGILADIDINARYYVTVTSASGNPPYTGNILSFAGTNGEIIITGQTAKFVYKASQNFVANVVGLVSTSSAGSKVKQLTSNTISIPYTANLITAIQTIELLKTDVVSVTSVYDALGNVYTKSFTLNNGQRDDYYDFGTLTYSGNIIDGSANITLTSGNPFLNVDFDYYEHTGSGFFNVDSYLDGGVDWGDIPSYTSSQGKPYRLSDVIDYRPTRKNDTSNTDPVFNQQVVNSPSDTMTADFYYYLPRRDKLILTKERQLLVLKGIPSKSPDLPTDNPDAMTLYTFDVPAYTSNPSDVKLVYINNRGFTMRDIGKIQKRVDRLEYYTALSFLEKIASDERIPSVVPGVDRFKNGILVDSFAGHSVSDVKNPDLACSIDFENNFMRPRFASVHVDYVLNETDSTSVVKEGTILTINYTPVPMIEQIKATNTINAAPFDVFNWVGRMSLTPATDVWGDTFNNPTVTVNLNGENDAFTQITLDDTGLTSWGTRYSEQQSVFKGVTDVKVDVSSSVNIQNEVKISNSGAISVVPKATTSTSASTTLTTQESFAQTGLAFSKKAQTITTNLGEKVVDTSIIPYIREKTIVFVAQGLKPSTDLFATFDNVPVADYIHQADRMTLQFPQVLPTCTLVRYINPINSTVLSEANVLHQRGNILYIAQNISTYPFNTANTVTLITSTGSLTAQVIVDLDLSEGTSLISDELGVAAGKFRIPNEEGLRFNMGERAFKIADSLDTRFITTVAETKYLAYGLSTTKEQTILATHMNLVSINPLLKVTKSAASTSTTTTTKTTEVTGSSNEVQLPQNEPSVKQTFYCGETVPKANGGVGEVAFKVNLGSSVGAANVNFAVGGVPDQLTVIYNGETRTTGMISDLWRATGTKNATLAAYDKRLVKLGFPEVSSNTKISGQISFIKQKEQAESLIIKIAAPLKETGWAFSVACPDGLVNGAAGSGALNAETRNIHVLWNKDHVRGGGWIGINPPVTSTPPVSSAYKFITSFTESFGTGLGQSSRFNVTYSDGSISSISSQFNSYRPKIGDQVKK